jgi:hypothetical protein
MADEKKIEYDLDGYEVITSGLLDLLNQYPGLDEGDEINFSTLDADAGKAIFPAQGAVIERERVNILGEVRQFCAYNFHLVYRVAGLSEPAKIRVKEWLDNLGRWLEGQIVTVRGTEYQLDQYPPLTKGRKITSIRRLSPGYLSGENENKSENWVIYLSARYENKYKRKV